MKSNCHGTFVVISLTLISRGPALAQKCDVALQFMQLEAAGNFKQANLFLDLPAEFAVFRDHPAFPVGMRPSSLTASEYEILKALGALVTFKLIKCESTPFFSLIASVQSIASIEVSRPDFVKLFPDRTEGITILIPKDAAVRKAFLATLRNHFGSVGSIPMLHENVEVPIVSTRTGPKVGLNP